MSINNVMNRLAVLAAMGHDEGFGWVSLRVHRRNDNPDGFKWQASIVGEGSDVPLLDSHGNESLAMVGSTPLDAMRALDTKLWGLP